MTKNRWRSTRARLNQETGNVDTTGLWSRIDASRRAGQSVDLPATDPRRPVTPVLLGVLAVAALIAFASLRISDRRAHVTALTDDPEASALIRWLPTPAEAQSIGASMLPPIDPPDVSLLTPRMLVYRYEEGVDGIVTGATGTDTITIGRNTVEGREQVAVVRTGTHGWVKMWEVVDSLVLANDGGFLFWHVQVKRAGTDRMARLATTLQVDSVTTTWWRSGGRPVPSPRTWPANIGQYVRDPLAAMLPSLPFREGFARSVSGLDLVRGTMTPGFARSLELRVTGTQSIRVPAGRFRCWTVELTAVYLPGDKPQVSRLWVDMESGSLVRAVWVTYNNFFEEQVLIVSGP